jgi:hypothetical protein
MSKVSNTVASAEYYQVLADQSDGKYTAQDVYNLEKYGVINPRELSDLEEQDESCICGESDCDEQYVHWTSGW